MVPAFLPWFLPFMAFFQGITTLLMIVFGLLIVKAVSRPGWRHHLRWAIPAAIAPAFAGLGRLPVYRLFGSLNAVQSTATANITAVVLYALPTLTALYATWTLWRTLRDLARHAASTDPLALHPAQTGVWPPPPTGRL